MSKPLISIMIQNVTGLTIEHRNGVTEDGAYVFTKLIFHGNGGIQEIEVFHDNKVLKIEDKRMPS